MSKYKQRGQDRDNETASLAFPHTFTLSAHQHRSQSWLCSAPLTVCTMEMQCNQSLILQLSPFSSLTCLTEARMFVNANQNITGQESFPRKCAASPQLPAKYLISFLNKIAHCLTADYITFSNPTAACGTPSACAVHKQHWKRRKQQQPWRSHSSGCGAKHRGTG